MLKHNTPLAGHNMHLSLPFQQPGESGYEKTSDLEVEVTGGTILYLQYWGTPTVFSSSLTVILTGSSVPLGFRKKIYLTPIWCKNIENISASCFLHKPVIWKNSALCRWVGAHWVRTYHNKDDGGRRGRRKEGPVEHTFCQMYRVTKM